MISTAAGQASGKVILFGEHAVVYGSSAIAAAIDRGATAVATSAETDSLSLNGELVSEGSELLVALRGLRESLDLPACSIDLDVHIPSGAGLGASAAMGVATARALLGLAQRSGRPDELFLAAQTWERVFHGNPSGVDVAAAMSQGAILFRKAAAAPDPLLLTVPLLIVIAEAGPPASTRKMVENVANFRVRNPPQFARTLDAIQALVENATLLLQSGDLRAVGKLMDLNQMLLSSWMLSTQDLERACHLAREAGAYGAKLTGSGGGGCVIALAGDAQKPESHELSKAIGQTWQLAGIRSMTAEVKSYPGRATA